MKGAVFIALVLPAVALIGFAIWVLVTGKTYLVLFFFCFSCQLGAG